MLVLGRKFGDSLIIEGPGLLAPICITILGTEGGKIRVGVDAPRTLAVYRKELSEKQRSMRRIAEMERAKEEADREEVRR